MAPKRRRRRRSSPEIIDFRCPSDDAWYGAVVIAEEEGEVLRITYTNFPESWDERFRADEFESEAKLEGFGGRFRRGSVQLQDRECGKVVEGMAVTVACRFGHCELRFYDAVVDSVNPKTHPLEEGQCSCTFVVLWQHGPLAGERTTTGIENICLLQPTNLEMDPIVTKFFETARRRLKERMSQATQINGHFQENSRENYEHDLVNNVVDYSKERPSNSLERIEDDMINANDVSTPLRPHGSLVSSRVKKKQYCPSRLEDKEASKEADDISPTPRAKEISDNISVDDIELGSDSQKLALTKKSHYFFRIENLEKDLSAVDVMDFILETIFLVCHAFICPNILEEFSSRATIFVETEEVANKLFEFLHYSSHIITSLGERPWVTNENWCGSVDGPMPRFDNPSMFQSKGHPRKLKLVYEGSKEFEKAKLLQAFHIEFHEHVRINLLRRLKDDEKKIHT